MHRLARSYVQTQSDCGQQVETETEPALFTNFLRPNKRKLNNDHLARKDRLPSFQAWSQGVKKLLLRIDCQREEKCR